MIFTFVLTALLEARVRNAALLCGDDPSYFALSLFAQHARAQHVTARCQRLSRSACLLVSLSQLPVSATCESVVTPAAGVVCSLVLLGTVLTFFIQEDYRRKATEHAHGMN